MKNTMVLATVFVVLAGAAAIPAAYRHLTSAIPRDEPLRYTVEPGMTLSDVAEELTAAGVVRHADLFTLIARLKGAEHGIHAGRYHIEPDADAVEVLIMLTTGRIVENRVAVPEGLTIPETARILQARVGIDSTTFVSLSNDSSVTRSLGIDAPTLEGYLYPATYNLYIEMSAEEIITEMTNLYRRTITEEYVKRAEELGYSMHEIVTLASIIEQEAMVEDERDIISGVFHNRLQRGMLLEADPTVQYGIGRPNMRLYLKHLSDPSPYNTYVHAGLPPGPICSPGKASIHAALYPRDVPYLFFMGRGDGRHIFSITNREHNRARAWVRSQQR